MHGGTRGLTRGLLSSSALWAGALRPALKPAPASSGSTRTPALEALRPATRFSITLCDENEKTLALIYYSSINYRVHIYSVSEEKRTELESKSTPPPRLRWPRRAAEAAGARVSLSLARPPPRRHPGRATHPHPSREIGSARCVHFPLARLDPFQ